MTFDSCLELILQWEGVYDNDPDDSGRETCFGITRKYQPEWIGWPVVDDLKKAQVPTSAWGQQAKLMGAVRVYYASLWQKHRMDEYPLQIRGIVFGGIVNQGPRVVRFCQEALTELCQPVEADGVLGPQTIAAFGRVSVDALKEKIWGKRVQAYIVAANKGNNGKYLLGWLNRLSAGA